MARTIRWGRIIPRDRFEGGVTRIVAASNATWTGVAHYRCDGTADQTEINNAIEDLPSAGGLIRLTDGTFYLSGKILINKSNVLIEGTGTGTRLILTDGADCPMIEIGNSAASVQNCVVRNIYLDGNAPGQTTANPIIYLHGYSGASVAYCRIEDCYLTASSGDGIYLVEAPRNIIYNNQVYDSAGDGIEITGLSGSNYVVNNFLQGNGGYGINISDSNAVNNVLLGNYFYNNASGEVNDVTASYYLGKPLIASRSLAFGTWEKIAEVVPSSDVQTITFTGLDLSVDKAYMLVAKDKNPLASGGDVRYLFVNDDTTTTNYTHQEFGVSGGSVSSAERNDARIAHVPPGKTAIYWVFIGVGTGANVFWMSHAVKDGPVLVHRYGWNTNHSNITKIEIQSDTAGAIAAGSRFMLFKVSS